MLIHVLRIMLWSAILLGIVGFAMLFTGDFLLSGKLLLTATAICFLGNMAAYNHDRKIDRKNRK